MSGISCPKFLDWNSSLRRLENVTGVCAVTRTADTKTSSSEISFILVVSFTVSCENPEKENRSNLRKQHLPDDLVPLRQNLLNKVFIRKMFTNKRGNYSWLKIKIDTLDSQTNVHFCFFCLFPKQHYLF